MQLSAQDEGSRLSALAECRIVDSPPEEFFDDIANQAAYLCGTPIGFISFIDSQREWLKAKVGWEGTEIPRNQSFNAWYSAIPTSSSWRTLPPTEDFAPIPGRRNRESASMPLPLWFQKRATF